MIWPMIAAPLAGGVTLAAFGRRLPRAVIGALACLAILTSFVVAVTTSGPLLTATFPTVGTEASGGAGNAAAPDVQELRTSGATPGAQGVQDEPGEAPHLQETLWRWFTAGDLPVDVGFRLDALAALMALVVTGVGLLIHLYAVGYMREDPDPGRFFAYMNFFVAAMLTLVLADNLVLLFLGWEGVGACSYLLIGFWYRDPANGAAARKAFVVTRIGDVALMIGLFLLVRELGTLAIGPLMDEATRAWSPGHPTATLAATLLLVGALGKSAQVPLQTWLPDAMAGPTPVSALIHAATMVTAGVYLIARTHELFLLAPAAMGATAALGALTAFLAGCSALVQDDIKRVLAYSTISQVGYMFAALGVGAFTAAMFHFMTHAFFKALLFLSAGIVTHACHGEGDITRMGALRRGRRLPGAAALAAVGAASLAGLPLITAGFYSKDAILWGALQPPLGGPGLLVLLLVTAGITAVYSFRWYFLIFSGDPGPATREDLHRPGPLLLWPCVGLAAGALLAGFLEMPETLGGYHGFGRFLDPVFAAGEEMALGAGVGASGPGEAAASAELAVQGMSGALALLGMVLAYQLFILRPAWFRRLAATRPARVTAEIWRVGWGADAAYEALLVRPYRTVAGWFRDEPVDDLLGLVTGTAGLAHRLLALTQSGRIRTYAAGLVAGALLLLGVWLLT